MNARRMMATGKDLAICLGLSIAGLLSAAPTGTLLAQATETTFRIVENGASIGSAAIILARSGDGWRVQSTSRAGGSIGLEVRRFDAVYDAAWGVRFLSMEIAWRQETRVIHVAIQGLRSRTDVVIPDREAGFGAHWISPGTIALPDDVFGAYQALAARVESLAPGSDIPLLLTPRGEVHGTIDAVRDEDVPTTASPIRSRHVSLIVMREVPMPIEIWVAKGMLLRVDLPLDHLSVIRSDLSQ
jgi:hypothetical protein